MSDCRSSVQLNAPNQEERNPRDKFPASGGDRRSAKRRRWDAVSSSAECQQAPSEWDQERRTCEETPKRPNRWDQTPEMVEAATPSKRSRWDQTPLTQSAAVEASEKLSRWDRTPISEVERTPSVSSAALALRTPTRNSSSTISAEKRWELELANRNRSLSDADLDSILPASGYVVVPAPESYVPIRTPSRKLQCTPAPQEPSFFIQEASADSMHQQVFGVPSSSVPADLPFAKPEDFQLFAKLLDGKPDDELSLEDAKERKTLKLLLRLKNGTPPVRRSALKTLTVKARELGAAHMLGQLLPLLMSASLEEQERHLFVKVLDRAIFRLDEEVRPWTHKILIVVEPMLVDEDYFARVQGRELIANLSKIVGLPTMISTMRPDVEHVEDSVRLTTAKALAVVVGALGITAMQPFIRAVCSTRRSWEARHTGIRIIQQSAILLGVAVLPHLSFFVACCGTALHDEQPRVRTVAALAISALAEASAPHGIESFDSVLTTLCKGLRQNRGKALAAFVKAVGNLVPLMDAEYANYYSKELFQTLQREFQTSDDEMRKIVLRALVQCCHTEGVSISQLRSNVVPEFFEAFWLRRMSLDRRNYRAVVEGTCAISQRIGLSSVLERLVVLLRDESEAFRRMTLEGICESVVACGSSDADDRTVELMIDGLIFSVQEATSEDPILMKTISAVVSSLGQRMRPFLAQIANTVQWRITNKSSLVRMLSMDLLSRIIPALKICDEDKLLTHFGTILFESLVEEYPEVLGSTLNAYKALICAVGVAKLTPPCKEVLPRLTPILRNRHEKVQEPCVELVGSIAERAAECVNAREWMRICFELLDNLRAPRKSTRRACVRSIGFVAKAIGPQDVLVTLLNNLKVQERTNRVATTVAIAIVAEICGPFTVLPSLLNEYRVPEQNVQNGVLKALGYLFEYLGEHGREYVYATTTLLEDALMDRDLVHRQLAASCVKHIAVNVSGCGFGAQDAIAHLGNFIWPNCLETSAQIIQTFFDALDGIRIALGSGFILVHCMQGLFHAARRVRDRFWRIYNQAYLGGQHAMVPFYPALYSALEAAGSPYVRWELDLFL